MSSHNKPAKAVPGTPLHPTLPACDKAAFHGRQELGCPSATANGTQPGYRSGHRVDFDYRATATSGGNHGRRDVLENGAGTDHKHGVNVVLHRRLVVGQRRGRQRFSKQHHRRPADPAAVRAPGRPVVVEVGEVLHPLRSSTTHAVQAMNIAVYFDKIAAPRGAVQSVDVLGEHVQALETSAHARDGRHSGAHRARPTRLSPDISRSTPGRARTSPPRGPVRWLCRHRSPDHCTTRRPRDRSAGRSRPTNQRP